MPSSWLASALAGLALSDAESCKTLKGNGLSGTPIDSECCGLQPSDCCARCGMRQSTTGCAGAVHSTNGNGSCSYFKDASATQAEAGNTTLIYSADPAPTPGPTPPAPVPPTPGPTPPSPVPTPPPAKGSYCEQPGWELVFEDEFDGTTLNPDNWNIMVGHDVGTLRQALGTKEDVYVENGNLVLRTRLDGYDPYTPRPQNCSVVKESTDTMGGSTVATTSAKDVGECCEQCQGNPTCAFFTYMPGSWGCDVGCCFQKSGDAEFNATSAPGRTSGYVPGAGIYKSGAVVSGGKHGGSSVPVGRADKSWTYGRFCVRAKLPGVEEAKSPRPENCSALMYDTDVLGSTWGLTQSAEDEGECCELCRGQDLCSYFVYMKGGWGCQTGCCYMKDATVTGFDTNASGRIAGFVPGARDKNQGIWPAHWMMPDVEDCWPSKGEIDIMEMINGDGQYHGTYHWTGDGSCNNDAANGGDAAAPQTWATEYHEYAVEWTEDHMFFVVDGEVKKVVTPGSPPTYGGPSPTTFYEVPYYWLLNTAVGQDGAWAGKPGSNTVLPAYHRIDYVRVAQKQSIQVV